MSNALGYLMESNLGEVFGQLIPSAARLQLPNSIMVIDSRRSQ
jgi:hypothetical protein